MGVVPSKISMVVQSPSFSLKPGESPEAYLQRVLETTVPTSSNTGSCLKGSCSPIENSSEFTTPFSLAQPPSLFLLDYPRLGAKPTDLPQVPQINYDSSYNEQIEQLRQHIAASVAPKKFMGLPVDGAYLANLIRHMTSENEETPSDNLLQVNLEHLSSALLAAYHSAMTNLSETTPSQSFEASHRFYMTTVFQHFCRGVWGMDVPTHIVSHKIGETASIVEENPKEFREVLKTWERMRAEMTGKLNELQEKSAQNAKRRKLVQFAAWGFGALSVAAVAALILFQ